MRREGSRLPISIRSPEFTIWDAPSGTRLTGNVGEAFARDWEAMAVEPGKRAVGRRPTSSRPGHCGVILRTLRKLGETSVGSFCAGNGRNATSKNSNSWLATRGADAPSTALLRGRVDLVPQDPSSVSEEHLELRERSDL